MKTKLLIATIIFFGLVYSCKSGNKADSDTTDSANIEEKTDSTGLDEITGGFVGIKQHSMMQKDTVKLYGDPDYDFAVIMQIHNKHGIAIADEEVKYGSDTAMRSVARNLKKNQENELKDLQVFLDNHSPSKNDEAFLNEMKANIEKAKDEMNKNTSMSGNFDRDFTALMALHHKQGIDVAKTEVKFGENSEMKKLAQKMIKQRTQDIKQLQY